MVENIWVLSTLLKIAFGLGGVVGLILISRWLDHRAGVKFNDIAQQIVAGNRAVALYFGLRILALAIIVGAAIY